jgi:ankyrin repeat protein
MEKSALLRSEWPLHWAVWENDYQSVAAQLEASKERLDAFDPRGRTPLLLAVTLGHLESAKVLLDNDANVNVEAKDGWTGETNLLPFRLFIFTFFPPIC